MVLVLIMVIVILFVLGLHAYTCVPSLIHVHFLFGMAYNTYASKNQRATNIVTYAQGNLIQYT